MATDEFLFPKEWIAHTQLLLDSYRHWLEQELIPRTESAQQDAMNLFEAPFVVVSHTTASDPILNYGNRMALNLWEFDISTLLVTPSRLTAEPIHRDERARLLASTTEHGYVDDYQGIRISKSGRRFEIKQAIVWNLIDADGTYRGQAATFSKWTPLADLAQS